MKVAQNGGPSGPYFTLSWNMDKDGVATIYATDIAGRVAEIADVYRSQIKRNFGGTEEECRKLQIRTVSRLCALWNAADKNEGG